jgi:thioredoxin 1
VANAAEITDATFEAEVVQSDKPVLVDFWAPWCAPCRTVGAVLDQLSGERDDLKIVKINIDDNQDQALKHSVLVLPTVVLYANAAGAPACRCACRGRSRARAGDRRGEVLK